MGQAEQCIGQADPEQRERHQRAFFADHIDQHAAGHRHDRADAVHRRHDETDFGVGQIEFAAEQRQQHVKRGRIPVREHMAGGNQPHFAW